MQAVVIGGMGVEAGQAFSAYIKSKGVDVVARSDKQHPCRVTALVNNGLSPVISIANEISYLVGLFGVKHVVMACNTANVYADDIQSIVPNATIHNFTAKAVSYASAVKACWLGTTAIAHYSNMVRQGGVCLPSDRDQDIIQQAIWNAKANDYSLASKVARIASRYSNVVAGCTEIPLILSRAYSTARIINPADFVTQ